jgi:hypothetical protein
MIKRENITQAQKWFNAAVSDFKKSAERGNFLRAAEIASDFFKVVDAYLRAGKEWLPEKDIPAVPGGLKNIVWFIQYAPVLSRLFGKDPFGPARKLADDVAKKYKWVYKEEKQEGK